MDNIEQDADGTKSLAAHYKPANIDDKLSRWLQCVDLEPDAKQELDWYSTQTFQMFLDALDLDQPRGSTTKETIKSASCQPSDRDEPSHATNQAAPGLVNKTGDNIKSDVPSDSKGSAAPSKHYFAETILSAEALKVLSEIPDLSHMSATRSFMFPSDIKSSTRKKPIASGKK